MSNEHCSISRNITKALRFFNVRAFRVTSRDTVEAQRGTSENLAENQRNK